MAKFDNGDFVKVSGSERVYIVDKLLHTQKQTIPVAADLEIYRVLDDDDYEPLSAYLSINFFNVSGVSQ